MKQTIIGIVVFVIGFLLLTFATMFGLVVAVGMLIAGPFIRRKLQKIKMQQENDFYRRQAGSQDPLDDSAQHQGNVLDGDFQDITDKK